MSSSPRWHVVRYWTHEGHLAVGSIRAAGFDAFWPREERLRHKRAAVIEPIFQGYLFAAFDAERDPWGTLKAARGVLDVLCTAQGRPLPLPGGLVETMIEASGGMNGIITAPLPGRAVRIAVGTGLRVTAGPFAGFDAIMRADHGDRVDVLMKLLGAEPVVRLGRDQVAVRE